jgi:hypothetical protein
LARAKALNERDIAQNARLKSEITRDLSSLGFKQRSDGTFNIDC